MRPALATILTILAAPAVAAAGDEAWSRLPPLPDKQGFAGMYAGVSNGALLAAGGANFPDKMPWDGGKKVWHDDVFVLEKPDGQWKKAGKLPRPLGYGVSVTHNGGVVCVGGSDADRHYADVFRLEWKDGKLVTTPLPALPKPVANACGTITGDVLYVIGGLEKPDASQVLPTVYSMDLSAAKPTWTRHVDLPGNGRMLAVASIVGPTLYVIGGVDLVRQPDGTARRRYLRTVEEYTPKQGWLTGVFLPYPVAAAPSPAPVDASGIYIIGGDDGTQVDVAPDQHKGFSRSLLRFDFGKNEWSSLADLPAGHVTAPCVRWGDSWVIVSGEIRPGVRSPDVWRWTPPKPRDADDAPK